LTQSSRSTFIEASEFGTENNVIAFHIGGDESDFARVSITRDNEDGWLSADVDIAVGRFRGSYPADFDTFAFSEFSKQLAVLYKTLSGSAEFTSLESQLERKLKCDALGHISVRGEARDVAGIGNKLLFDLEIDQTHVPQILNSLKATLKKHPVRPF
jgi:hypothetical protein